MSSAKKNQRARTPPDAVSSPFERDKQRALFLLREMLLRVEKEGNPNSIGRIGPIVRELDELDLLEKLGVYGRPLIFDQREEPHFERVEVLIWNEPFGTMCGEIIVHKVMKLESQPGRTLPMQRDLSADRTQLASVLQAWIRATDGIQEPAVYPVLPRFIAPGVDHRLWADPFWRRLHELVALLAGGSCTALGVHGPKVAESCMRRVNRLAESAGMHARLVFVRKGKDLLVFKPDADKPASIDPDPFVHSTDGKARAAAVAKVTKIMRTWQRARARILLASARKGSEGEDSKAPPPDLPVLSAQARAMYDILCSLPESEGRRAKQLVKELGGKFPGIDEDRVRHLAQELKPYGIQRHGSAGYFVPMSVRRIS